MPRNGRPATVHVRRALAVLAAAVAAIVIGHQLDLPGPATTIVGCVLIGLALLILEH